TALVEPRLRDWVTETEWLPRLDGYLLGQDFFEMFTYNGQVSAGYARLRTTNDQPSNYLYDTNGTVLTPYIPGPSTGVSPTDVATNTLRASIDQELSAPFSLGAFRLAPYGRVVLLEYSSDINGNEVGRVWGGGGVRGSLPLTRLYPEVQSELLNL